MVTTVSSHSGLRDRRGVRRLARPWSFLPVAGPRYGVPALRGWSGSFIAVILSVEPASHREPARASGHTTRSTCPTTRSRGIIPPPGAPSRDLESVESARLSPRTNMRPSGTCRSKLTVLGATVSGRYGSLSAVPSMVSRPCTAGHPFPTGGDDPFDPEFAVGVGRGREEARAVQDHDVPALGGAPFASVGQDHVPRLQGGLHGGRGDREGLDHEVAHQAG